MAWWYEWAGLAGVYPGRAAMRVATDARLRYVAIYGGGALAALFHHPPYKTPWCIISILWPFYLILGATVAAPSSVGGKCLLLAGMRCFFSASLGRTIWLNYFHYADHKIPYVYVQTDPEIGMLTDPLLQIAGKDPATTTCGDSSVLDSYYPLHRGC